MKTAPIFLLLAFAFAPVLIAQDAATGADPTGRLQLAPAPTVDAPATLPETDVPLIPEEVPQTEKPKGKANNAGAALGKSKTDESAEKLALRIRYREARIKALRDPKIQDAWTHAQSAKTDLGKREGLKVYYTMLFARILALDSSVKPLVAERQTVSFRRLTQTRVSATEAFDSAGEVQ